MNRKQRRRQTKEKRTAEDARSLAARAAECRRREPERALALCRRALALDPDDAGLLHLAGELELERGNAETAYRLLEAAAAGDSGSTRILETLGTAAVAAERLEEAAAAFNRVLEAEPGNFAVRANLGGVLLMLERRDEAAAAFEQALAAEPRSVPVLSNLALLKGQSGEREAASELFRRIFEIAPDDTEAWHDYSLIKTFRPGDPDLGAMERLRAAPHLPAGKALFLDFALAKAYDELGEHDRAFVHMAAGNRAKRASLSYDVADDEKLVERIVSVFDEGFFESRAGSGLDDGRPVFILGMPRSGTSLVEQILASHSRVHGAGELTHLRDAILGRAGAGPGVGALGGKGRGFPEGAADLGPGDFRALGEAYVARLERGAPAAARITDKMPRNVFFLGLIHLALPAARIIHCVRDPVDTCLSCYQIHFADGQEFAYDLQDLGRYYRLYRRLMDHWRAVLPGRFLDLRYEDLVAEPEPRMRELLAFCGLEWEDACLAFHETGRPVRTASAQQVRRPIYRTAVKRWKRYERHLEPLLEALGTVADND